uniref:Uncharacterized protein n=1 Tax=Setaria digitata TaxID=48799 RepID=A0A915PX68_9BILA
MIVLKTSFHRNHGVMVYLCCGNFIVKEWTFVAVNLRDDISFSIAGMGSAIRGRVVLLSRFSAIADRLYRRTLFNCWHITAHHIWFYKLFKNQESFNHKKRYTGVSEQPKKAVVEHSIRLSFHNELPKSEGSAENSFKTTAKHRPKTLFMKPDGTQSGVVCSKNLLPSKYTPTAIQICREAQKTVKKPPVSFALKYIVRGEKLTEDLTQVSIPSVDLTQMTTASEEFERQSSKTLTESTMESREQQDKAFLKWKQDMPRQETPTLNITVNHVLDAEQNKRRQPESHDSGSARESQVSVRELTKQSEKSPLLSTQPG